MEIEPLAKKHIKFVYKLLSNHQVDLYNTLGIHKSIVETKKYVNDLIQRGKGNKECAFVIKIDDEDYIGLIALLFSTPKFKAATLWYKLHPDYWNMGYATQATDLVLKIGFGEYQLHRIEAGCATNNMGSQKVLLKNGFKKEGCKKKVLPLKSGWSDAYIYALLKGEFQTIC